MNQEEVIDVDAVAVVELVDDDDSDEEVEVIENVRKRPTIVAVPDDDDDDMEVWKAPKQERKRAKLPDIYAKLLGDPVAALMKRMEERRKIPIDLTRKELFKGFYSGDDGQKAGAAREPKYISTPYPLRIYKKLLRWVEKDLGHTFDDIEEGCLVRDSNRNISKSDSATQTSAQYGRTMNGSGNVSENLLYETMLSFFPYFCFATHSAFSTS